MGNEKRKTRELVYLAKKCVICGNGYVGVNSRSRYCGNACAVKSHRVRKALTDKELKSMEEEDVFRLVRYMVRFRQDNTFVKKCPVCGEKFATEIVSQVYCSEVCEHRFKMTKSKFIKRGMNVSDKSVDKYFEDLREGVGISENGTDLKKVKRLVFKHITSHSGRWEWSEVYEQEQ